MLSLPEYATCEHCGEYADMSLRVVGDDAIQCLNCRNHGTHQMGECLTCGKRAVPIEHHHVAGRRHHALTIPVCLNCHALLSEMQRGWYPSHEPYPARYFVQGLYDVLTTADERHAKDADMTWALLCAGALIVMVLALYLLTPTELGRLVIPDRTWEHDL